MIGYIKRFVRKDKMDDNEGALWVADFYLANGSVVDWDQKFFIKDGEDVDDVLSKAYYEKQMFIIKQMNNTQPVTAREDEIVEPKPFNQFKSEPEFKEQGKEILDMLKNNEMPELETMPMSPEDAIETK